MMGGDTEATETDALAFDAGEADAGSRLSAARPARAVNELP